MAIISWQESTPKASFRLMLSPWTFIISSFPLPLPHSPFLRWVRRGQHPARDLHVLQPHSPFSFLAPDHSKAPISPPACAGNLPSSFISSQPARSMGKSLRQLERTKAACRALHSTPPHLALVQRPALTWGSCMGLPSLLPCPAAPSPCSTPTSRHLTLCCVPSPVPGGGGPPGKHGPEQRHLAVAGA